MSPDSHKEETPTIILNNPDLSRPVVPGVSLISEFDVYIFKQGTHYRLYNKLGPHPVTIEGVSGTYFAVWAPNAQSVSVVGNFNNWATETHHLYARSDDTGIWEGFIPNLGKGEVYKYNVHSKYNNYRANKGDPFAVSWEVPPKTASVVWDTDYRWNDGDWMAKRQERNALHSPISVYEVHLGSWRRVPDEGHRCLTYRETAEPLAAHVKDMGFTHVEFLPVMEHPFYGSWGYQTVGYFAPTSRFGTPQDFMYLVDYLHQQGIGVILDWVPSHFPGDEHGLVYYDGTHLYEHADPRKGFHPDWKSYIFNYGRNEVVDFLMSSAMFWLDKYHVDSLRVDAVASMLYLDYSRQPGEWIPNKYGGKDNLEAIAFLKKFNEEVYKAFPDVQTVAEESTSWPQVSRPTFSGGLGFGMKWNMGWMHDTLVYFAKDPVYRKHHHNQLTFSMLYAFTENFVLPFSHDEVVHGKGSLINKMPGDDWQKFANLRLLLSYCFVHPGKKLLFMGAELGQRREWNHDESLDWHLAGLPPHQGIMKVVRDMNLLYKNEPALFERDFDWWGFEWIDCNDWERSVLSFIRRGSDDRDILLVTANFTPVPRHNYRVGVPFGGDWMELYNSDAADYGGSGVGNKGRTRALKSGYQGRPYSLSLSLPPLGLLVLKPEHPEPEPEANGAETEEASNAGRGPVAP